MNASISLRYFYPTVFSRKNHEKNGEKFFSRDIKCKQKINSLNFIAAK